MLHSPLLETFRYNITPFSQHLLQPYSPRSRSWDGHIKSHVQHWQHPQTTAKWAATKVTMVTLLDVTQPIAPHSNPEKVQLENTRSSGCRQCSWKTGSRCCRRRTGRLSPAHFRTSPTCNRNPRGNFKQPLITVNIWTSAKDRVPEPLSSAYQHTGDGKLNIGFSWR